MRENATLPAKQLRAIEALLREPSTRAAAASLGINEATLWRWRASPDFRKAHREAQSRLFDDAVATLQAATGEAVEALRGVLKDEQAKPGDRISAARAIIEYSMRAREMIEIEERLRVLEEAMQPAAKWG